MNYASYIGAIGENLVAEFTDSDREQKRYHRTTDLWSRNQRIQVKTQVRYVRHNCLTILLEQTELQIA